VRIGRHQGEEATTTDRHLWGAGVGGSEGLCGGGGTKDRELDNPPGSTIEIRDRAVEGKTPLCSEKIGKYKGKKNQGQPED